MHALILSDLLYHVCNLPAGKYVHIIRYILGNACIQDNTSEGCSTVLPACKDRSLVILHFNDVYNIEPSSREPAGGAARLAHRVGWLAIVLTVVFLNMKLLVSSRSYDFVESASLTPHLISSGEGLTTRESPDSLLGRCLQPISPLDIHHGCSHATRS